MLLLRSLGLKQTIFPIITRPRRPGDIKCGIIDLLGLLIHMNDSIEIFYFYKKTEAKIKLIPITSENFPRRA